MIPQAPTVTIPRAQSRAELRKALEAHPKVLPLLELELDTLGEDWLLALQDELTKPYFLSVGVRFSHPAASTFDIWYRA